MIRLPARRSSMRFALLFDAQFFNPLNHPAYEAPNNNVAFNPSFCDPPDTTASFNCGAWPGYLFPPSAMEEHSSTRLEAPAFRPHASFDKIFSLVKTPRKMEVGNGVYFDENTRIHRPSAGSRPDKRRNPPLQPPLDHARGRDGRSAEAQSR